MEFTRRLSEAVGADVLFKSHESAEAGEIRQGGARSRLRSMCWKSWAETHPIARMVLDYRQLTKLKSTYVDALPALINPATGAGWHTLRLGRRERPTGRLSSANPKLAEYFRFALNWGRGDSRRVYWRSPGHVPG